MLYIAYGSNMDFEQMRYRCPYARFVKPIMLDGWRLMFKGSLTGSYATIEREIGCVTPALLWEVTPIDERMLDRYEGFPKFYYKQYLDVPGCGLAMVYIMHEYRSLGVPTNTYYNVLDAAYKKFGWDRKILREALKYSKKKPA